ncbi:Protein tilB [Rhizoclosmatium sp. JEL0117]|nr:Protein tilB [Rhizoclosmatium sp. JEL0117]
MPQDRQQKIITQELLRRRAEHNDGELSTLKEVTLHQFDIEKIENLDVYCRHLEILYLQNNQINKIENLHKLKELQYLNLALNNIKKIENLEKCESLRKLDLTVNFVSDPLDLESLKDNIMLRDLFLVGNPCTQVDGYREFAIVTLPQLKMLDGKEIEKSERIAAAQVYDTIRARLVKERNERTNTETREENLQTKTDPTTDATRTSPEDLEKLKHEFKTKPIPYTPETRRQTAKEIETMNGPPREDPSKPKPPKAADTTVTYGRDGRVLQKNEGKWEFHRWSNDLAVFLDIEISKFLDSSLIDVNVKPNYIQVVIKNKVLTVTFDDEVRPNQVLCERSKASGNLLVTMVKSSAPNDLDVEDVAKAQRTKNVVTPASNAPTNTEKNRRKERLFGATDAEMPKKIVDMKFVVDKSIPSASEEFTDDPDVPPLC